MSKNPLNLRKRLLVWIVIDLVLLGIFLVTFAYFHHVRVVDYAPTALAATTPTPPPTPTPALAAPDSTDQTSPAPDTPAGPTPNVSGLLKGKYAEKFTAGEIEHGDMHYRSANVSIEVTKHASTDPYMCYYLADIYIQDITSFQTAVAKDYAEKNPADIKSTINAKLISELVGSIISMTGDNFAPTPAGRWIVRNGLEWVRKYPIDQDICVLYYDGVMETYRVRDIDVDAITARNPYQIWSFGPELLVDGQATTKFTANNGSGNKVNPRGAIGYYEPGHYCFLLVDGRQSGYSIGMTYADLSTLFAELGCTAAYNLDGGDTAVMCWGAEWINRPQDAKPRSCADFLYIVEPSGTEEQP